MGNRKIFQVDYIVNIIESGLIKSVIFRNVNYNKLNGFFSVDKGGDTETIILK